MTVRALIEKLFLLPRPDGDYLQALTSTKFELSTRDVCKTAAQLAGTSDYLLMLRVTPSRPDGMASLVLVPAEEWVSMLKLALDDQGRISPAIQAMLEGEERWQESCRRRSEP